MLRKLVTYIERDREMEESRPNSGEQNRVSLVMIAEGLFVGVLAGLTVILYRVCLSYATKWLEKVLQFL